MPKYELIEAKNVTASILNVALKPLAGESPFSFQPGQYAAISFRRHRRPSAMRCFSITSSPMRLDCLEFGIRMQGKYTNTLQKLSNGTEFDVQGPYGSFVIGPNAKGPIVMLAGGIGITPFMSMLRYYSEVQNQLEFQLFFSVRSQDDIPYLQELYELADKNTALNINIVVSSKETDTIRHPIKAVSGRMNEKILLSQLGERLVVATYFICGPPPFMKGMKQNLLCLGVRKGNIITEAFSQGHDKQSGRSRNWPLNIYALGALGALASTVLVAGSDMMKSIPPTILPKTLASDESSSKNRSQDLDQLIQTLSSKLSGLPSPAVVSANQEVLDAERKIAELNNTPKPQSTQKTATTVSQSTTTTTPAPKPAPQPVCTTSASGVTICN